MRYPSRILVALALIAAAVAGTRSADAQAWPTRPVRFIIPLGAGSGVDITARLFADKLSQRWASRSWWRTGRAATP